MATGGSWWGHLAELYLEAVFETWAARSRHQWTLDISLLSSRYGIDDGRRTSAEAPVVGVAAGATSLSDSAARQIRWVRVLVWAAMPAPLPVVTARTFRHPDTGGP
jgi:hypothetical protein